MPGAAALAPKPRSRLDLPDASRCGEGGEGNTFLQLRASWTGCEDTQGEGTPPSWAWVRSISTPGAPDDTPNRAQTEPGVAGTMHMADMPDTDARPASPCPLATYRQATHPPHPPAPAYPPPTFSPNPPSPYSPVRAAAAAPTAGGPRQALKRSATDGLPSRFARAIQRMEAAEGHTGRSLRRLFPLQPPVGRHEMPPQVTDLPIHAMTLMAGHPANRCLPNTLRPQHYQIENGGAHATWVVADAHPPARATLALPGPQAPPYILNLSCAMRAGSGASTSLAQQHASVRRCISCLDYPVPGNGQRV